MLTVTYDNNHKETRSYEKEDLEDFLDGVNHPINFEHSHSNGGFVFETNEDETRRLVKTLLRFTANLTVQLVKSGALAPEGVAEALEGLSSYTNNLAVKYNLEP